MDAEATIEALERDLSRRKRELSVLKANIADQADSDDEPNWLTRSAVALSYAHWEGFVKKASIKYLKHINAQRLRVDKLQMPLQAGCFVGHFKRAGLSNKSHYLGSILLEIDRHRGGGIFSVNPEKFIDTESNLSSTVFRELVRGIGLVYLDGYQMRHAFIDERLLRSRNQVVHGELVEFDSTEAIDRIDGALYMIQQYFEHLNISVRDRSYLKE